MDEALAELGTRIRNGAAVQTSEHEEQELYYDLERRRSRMLQLFDVGSRSTEEAKDLENRHYKLDGKKLELNNDLVRPSLFVAQQLECSEYHCAGLLARVERRYPNLEVIQLVEKAIEVFHGERSALLYCLVAIFEGSSDPQLGSTTLGVVLQKFTRELVGTMLNLGGGRRGRLPELMLNEIDRSIETTAKLSNSITQADSNTVIVAGQGGSRLSHDVLEARLNCLRAERRQLGYLLFATATLRHLSGVEIIKMVQRLAEKPSDDMVHYILTSTLVALDLPGPSAPLYNDLAFVASLSKLLDNKSEWKSLRLRAVLALKWSLFIWTARHQDPELAEASNLPDGFGDDDVEKRVTEAVQSDIFPFLSETTQAVRPRGAVEDADRHFTGLGLKINKDGEIEPDIVDDGFKIFVLRAFESLVTTFIVSMSAVIRRIKHRQEDVGLAASRASRPPRHPNADDAPAPVPRNDIAELFEFIGVLYTYLPPEEGLKFWVASTDSAEGKLFAFVRWATESNERTMISAAYDMLAGIARGRSAAEVVYNFLSSSGSAGRGGYGGILAGGGNAFTWSTLFGTLAWWAETLPNSHTQHQHQHGMGLPERWQQPTLSDGEALMIGAFLRLLRVVVKYAPAARIALYSMPDFRVIPTLLVLLQHGIQLELKGVIFDVLAAFCEPGAGVPGVEICKNVWAALERAELVNLRSGGGLATRGVENELEGVETPAQRYPATVPFLHLLNTLIHTPKSLPQQQTLVEYEPLETIPDGLGQPTRLGGIAPYVRFVVDTVLLRARNREYLDPSDKWKMIEGSLCFVERCLASYNLQSLLALGEEVVVKNPEVLRSFQVHPGFDLLIQLLTDSPLRSELVDYITQGLDALESKAIRNVYFEKVVLRVLRIVHRVLEIQDLFIELLLPLIAQLDGSSDGSINFLSSAIVPFDQLLNWSSKLVVKIAACTLHAQTDETKLLAVKIITLLSESPVFTAMDQAIQNHKRRLNRLAVVLERDEESNIIADGFMILLQRDSVEDSSVSPEFVDMLTGAGAPSAPAALDLGHTIRLAILQLFLQNTVHDKPAPNVAHSLLGYYLDPSHHDQLALQDPHATSSRKTCLHAILDLLNTGVPRAAIGDGSHGTPAFLITHPVFAERCYRLVYQLCSHRTTSAVTMRYLRTHENFFSRHMSSLPFRAPASAHGIRGQVIYGDNTYVATTSITLTSFLRVRAWVLESAALELHILTEMGQTQRASRLLALLFGSNMDSYDSMDPLDGLLQPFAPGQSLIRIIELFRSFDLDWNDGLAVEQDKQLQFFGALNVSACLRINDSGCEIFDVDVLLSIMHHHRKQMQSQEVASNPHINEQLRDETKYILTSCTIENNRRQIQHAKGIGLESWKKLLDICLTKGFHSLPQDRRESILFDLLQILPPAIQNELTQQTTGIILSEVMLSLVTKLRDDRQQQLLLQSTFDDTYAVAFPIDRLKVLLKSILTCLASSGKVELIRGNLYASLVNYLHLVKVAHESRDLETLGSEHRFSLSLSASRSSSMSQDDLISNASEGTVNPFSVSRSRGKRPELETSTLAVINKDVDGLVSIVSTDAIDGTEVWKTVSFTLLDSLVALSRLEKPHRVLAILTRKGYLHNFIQGVKDSDLDLQQVLRPDPDNLNALYVYEAKMALLIRIAQTRLGAQKLVENRLFHVLSQCDFIGARPETDQSFLDQDNFLPSAVHRYHQLVLPALELINSVVATLGASSQASRQALDFVLAHRETFLILLRDSYPTPSLAQIREMHLVVFMCSYAVSQVDRADLRTRASGFGGIHAAILSLAARCLFKGRWQPTAAPANDTEREEATMKAPGYGQSLNIFDAKVHTAADILYEAIWVYLEAASDSNAENEFAPMFTPVSVAKQQDELSSQIHAPAPTISDSVEALRQVVNDLSKVLGEVVDITAKLANKDNLGLEEIEQIALSSRADYMEELDMMQRRLLAYKELGRAREARVNKALRHLHSLEIQLLLIWRHVDYYSISFGGQVLGTANGTSASFARSTFGKASVLKGEELGTLLDHIRRGLRPVLERLDGIQLPVDVVGPDHRSREGYIEMMCRLIMKAIFEEQTNTTEGSAVDSVAGLGSW